MPNTITAAQANYLKTLIGQAFANDPAVRASSLLALPTMTSTAASSAINNLKAIIAAQPKPKPVAQMPEYIPPFGLYLVGGDTIQVKKPKYEGAPIYVFKNGAYGGSVGFKGNALIASLNSPQAAHAAVIAYARKTGKCGVCNTKLTDPKSIAKGIGPVCEKKYA